LWGLIDLSGAAAMHRWLLHAMSPSVTSALVAETTLAILAFLPATIAMGALFSHLSTEASIAGVGLERALAINTFGAALAPLLFGVLLVTHVDSRVALSLVALGYLLLTGTNAWRSFTHWGLATAALALLAWGPSLAIVDVPEGGHVVQYREGVMAAVSVVEDASGVATLHINNRQQEGSSVTRFSDARQALLPALLHAHPQSALFLGLGTGVTAWSASGEPDLQVDVVELLPEVIDASAYFTKAFDAQHAPHLINADARRFVRTSTSRYDLIVSDNFHPARSGSSALYTVEHFAAVKDRLASGGLFCQWLPLHQLDLDTLRSIVRSYIETFPDSYAVIATNTLETPVIGLVAHRDGERFDVAAVASRLTNIRSSLSSGSLGFNDELSVLGSFIAGPLSLKRFSSGAELNTDDHPVVSYLAPRETYAPESRPRDRLLSLLRELELNPDELGGRMDDKTFTHRLTSYWAARNRFLEVGRDVQPTSDVRQMLSQVREPLLSVLRISPDFRPAYDPLLKMALALGDSDANAARDLLGELADLQPDRSEAREALTSLVDH
ncbi:MAG: spermidine synthase, partial [Povalibacter sp.]